MEGLGTDEATLIKVISNRIGRQRQQIKVQYKATYGRDLIEDIKKECHGKLDEAFVALFKDPIEYDVEALREGMKGLGTKEDTLIEIIAASSPYHLFAIKNLYKQNITEISKIIIKKKLMEL